MTMPGSISFTTALPLGGVHLGDNLPFMQSLPEASIDLIYLDPPFNTGGTLRGDAGRFSDAWTDVGEYLAFLRPRLVESHRLLKPTGSILLHCDWRACHHLRIMLDGIFGPERFVNHLIWSYGLGGSSPRRFARKHDDILFYSRSGDYHFEPPRVPATSRRLHGQTKKATDVLEVPSINNMASERTGWPTQKPLALLELLVRACSPVRGVVADFFCGSGTTLVAAARLGRWYLGADASAEAVAITRARLDALARNAHDEERGA